MPGTTIRLGLTNHVMGTTRNHPYFQLLLDRLQAYDYNWVLPYMTIMNSAGPHFVSMVWEEYIHTARPRAEVRVLKQDEYSGHEWSFFTKEQGGTWNHWDTRLFKWAGYHVLLFAVICFVALCSAISCLWWIGWKFAARGGTNDVKSHVYTLPLWRKAD